VVLMRTDAVSAPVRWVGACVRALATVSRTSGLGERQQRCDVAALAGERSQLHREHRMSLSASLTRSVVLLRPVRPTAAAAGLLSSADRLDSICYCCATL
jgi:hypothetical protein